jgi:LysR family transcriptional regulator, transcriptional activator of nhaA
MPIPRRLNYQHLLYFWSVVRTGSVTRAAAELSLSPPTVSAQLRTLEERLGEKLLEKSGRKLVPTEVGRVVFGFADQIFDVGRELLDALDQRPSQRPLRFNVGIDDVLPKEIAQRLLEPAMRMGQPVRISCREGTLDRLVGSLAMHELDVVLSDAPVSPSLSVRAYNHLLGSTGVCWMATPAIATSLRRNFPRSLDGVPMLLPTDDTAIRRTLDQWLEQQDVRPVLVGEFEDYALLREFARAGHGFAPVPVVQEAQFRREYGFQRVGAARPVTAQFFAISLERRVRHPAVAAVVAGARELFAASIR